MAVYIRFFIQIHLPMLISCKYKGNKVNKDLMHFKFANHLLISTYSYKVE